LSKDNSGQTSWHKAALRGNFELLEKLWDCAKELQLKPEDLRNEVLFLKDESRQRIWLMAARGGKVVLLEMLWECAKWLQLISEGLRSEVMSKTSMDKQPGTSQQADFTLNYYKKGKNCFCPKDNSGQTACLMATLNNWTNYGIGLKNSS
jgi:ankyrin repeat protein